MSLPQLQPGAVLDAGAHRRGDDGGHDLLSELGLTLLDGGKEHVTDGTGGESVELSSSHAGGNHEQVLCAGVVTAVHDRSHWETV